MSQERTFKTYELLVQAIKDKSDDLDAIYIIVDPRPLRGGGAIATPSGVVKWCTGTTWIGREAVEGILNDANIRNRNIPFRLIHSDQCGDL